MEVLHQTEKPRPLVATRLLQAFPCGYGLIIGIRELVLFHARMGELPLPLVQPTGCEGSIREKEKADNGNNTCGSTLDNKKPGGYVSCRSMHNN